MFTAVSRSFLCALTFAAVQVVLAQQPAKNNLLFSDDFSAPLDPLSWTATGSCAVGGGELTMSGNSSLRFTTGFLQSPLIITVQGLRFTSLVGDGSSLGLSQRSLGNPSGSGSLGYSILVSGSTMLDGTGYGQGSLEGFSIGDTYQSLPTAAKDYTFGWDHNGSVLYHGTNPFGFDVPYPSLNAGRIALQLNTSGNASMSLTGVTVHSGFETNPVVRFAPKNATTPLDFGATLGLTASVKNNNLQSYGALTAEKITSSPINLPGGATAIGGKVWQMTGMTALSFQANLTMTFPTSDVTNAGFGAGSLKGYKSNDNGKTWAEVSGNSVALSGSNTLFTYGTVTSFSHFAIGGLLQTAADDWQLLE